jgi:hypothetical protein
MRPNNNNNVYILGAGFSAEAGLPLVASFLVWHGCVMPSIGLTTMAVRRSGKLSSGFLNFGIDPQPLATV